MSELADDADFFLATYLSAKLETFQWMLANSAKSQDNAELNSNRQILDTFIIVS